MNKAVFFVHGSVASSFKQVAGFLTGDEHDRSKVQVYVDGRFYDISLEIPNKDSSDDSVRGYSSILDNPFSPDLDALSTQFVFRPANMRIQKTAMVAYLPTDRNAQEAALSALYMGVGGYELVTVYGEILEACDQDLLETLINRYPVGKVNEMARAAALATLPKLKKVVETRLAL